MSVPIQKEVKMEEDEEYISNDWNLMGRRKHAPKHSKLPYIPVDEGIWGQNKNHYVIGHSAEYEKPLFVEDWVKRKNARESKRKGGPLHEYSSKFDVDLDKDGELDTVIYQDDKPIVWNGYHYVANYPMLDREKFMHDRELAEQYGYKMSKYRFSQMSSFDQKLSELAKEIYAMVKKWSKTQRNKDIIRKDLGTQFWKTFIKTYWGCYLLIKSGKIVSKTGKPLTMKQFKGELHLAAEKYDADEDYRITKDRNLMALFRTLSKIYDDMTEEEQIKHIQNAEEAVAGALQGILEEYLNYTNGSSKFKSGDKLHFIATILPDA